MPVNQIFFSGAGMERLLNTGASGMLRGRLCHLSDVVNLGGVSVEIAVLPDELYGVVKIFGEARASLYHSAFGQKTAIVRIGSCDDNPTNWRMLSIFLSHDDLLSVLEAVFRVQKVGCLVIWGVSANEDNWWNNSHLDFPSAGSGVTMPRATSGHRARCAAPRSRGLGRKISRRRLHSRTYSQTIKRIQSAIARRII